MISLPFIKNKKENSTSIIHSEQHPNLDTAVTEIKGLEIAQRAGQMGVWDYDIVHDKSYLSKELQRLYAMDPNTNYSPSLKKALDFVHSDDRKAYQSLFYKAIKHKENFTTELRIIRIDSTIFEARIQTEIILDENNKPIRIVGIVQDITNQKRIKEELHETESKFQHLADNLEAGIWTFDVPSSVFWTSKGIEKITGYTPKDFNGKITWSSIIHPEDKEMYESQQVKLRNGENLFHRYRIIHRDGTPVWIQDQTLPLVNDNGKLTRLDGIVTDISEQKAYEEKMKHVAYHDYLTDLPAWELFSMKVDSLIEAYKGTQQAFSIMYLNLDRFRNINHTLGHVIGDKLIKETSNRMKELLPNEAMLARFAGHEFALVIWGDNDPDYPIAIAKTIIDGLHQPFFIDDYELNISTSVGISSYPINGNNSEELIKNANTALTRAKKLGKNAYQIYSPSLNIDSFKQYYLERDLRKSIQNQELKIQFQPRVEAQTGKIVSAEALVRWEHPVWGLVSPNEFIPLAEETGFVNDIGDWVFEQSCLYMKEWEKENLSIVPISINISAQRFLKNDWKEVFTTILEKTNVDPSLIEFEITETTLIHYEDVVETALQSLKEFGFLIALDDFGTGYSSHTYLHKFPIDTIKIDQSFISLITKSEKVEVIIKSLIFMTKGLDLNVVAEGVETIEQLAFLRQQECSEIQGYIYSKPVDTIRFTSLLKRQVLKISFNKGSSLTKNRRKFFRIPLTFPLGAEMTLASIQGRSVNVGRTEVVIEDIGPGGIRFLSNIHLPVRPDILYKFETIILGDRIPLFGKIAWKEEVKGVFSYGVEFTIDGKDRDSLINKLNQFLFQLRKNPFDPNSNIIKDDRFRYLNKLQQKAHQEEKTITQK